MFPHPPGDQLGVLRAEIDNENCLTLSHKMIVAVDLNIARATTTLGAKGGTMIE